MTEKSKNSQRACSADFWRPFAVASTGIVVVDIDVEVVVVVVAIDVAVVVAVISEYFLVIVADFKFNLGLIVSFSGAAGIPIPGHAKKEEDAFAFVISDEIAVEGMVMQSNETFFPFPALRAATHNSAMSSRLIRVIDAGCWFVVLVLVLVVEVM